jgi:hypothetical protein
VADFVFTLHADNQRASEAMLEKVCATVLGHLGYDPTVAGETIRGLADAISRGAGRSGSWDVKFRVEGRQLVIAVSSDRGEWQTTRPLP